MQLFEEEPKRFDLPNAQMEYIPNFLNKEMADALYAKLFKETDWRADEVKVFGKTYMQPRLTTLFSDSGQSYSYSGLTMHAESFTPTLKQLKQHIELRTQSNFTSVLLNLYRDGNDSNGWHADNEKELGENPTIASLSLGEERWFHFKHRTLKEQRHKLLLEHGSLLLMKGEMQHFWLHQIPKTKKKVGSRINLTFRKMQTL